MTRTRSEIAGAARITREVAAFGERRCDDTSLPKWLAMAKVAAALAWAAGQDNEFAEVLAECRAIDTGGAQ